MPTYAFTGLTFLMFAIAAVNGRGPAVAVEPAAWAVSSTPTPVAGMAATIARCP